jgi:protein-L-isoaspartate(D-aspartate) O-methyltransferase
LNNTELKDTFKHQGQRNQLIDLLKSKGISSAHVLDVMNQIPRHLFLPVDFESHAYEDKAFPIEEGQTISQPYTVAYQTQLLNIQKGDKVLEIGTGSGYQALVLMLMGAELFSIERHALLSQLSIGLLNNIVKVFKFKIHYQPHFLVGDGTKGWMDKAPFDKIIVTAAAPAVPKALVNQLNVGGVLIIPVGQSLKTQKMVRLTKKEDGSFSTEVFDEFSFVPLLGENGW